MKSSSLVRVNSLQRLCANANVLFFPVFMGGALPEDRQRQISKLVKNNVAPDLKRSTAEIRLVGAETAETLSRFPEGPGPAATDVAAPRN